MPGTLTFQWHTFRGEGQFKDNRQVPIYNYSKINFTSSTGLNEEIQTSKQDVGIDFKSAFKKWVHFFGPVNVKTKVDSFIGYAAHLGLIRGGTPSGLYC